MENERMKGRGEGTRREERGGDRKSWLHPNVRNPERYPDCRTDLIGGGGNTDVCPGRQTPSRRHCHNSNDDGEDNHVLRGSVSTVNGDRLSQWEMANFDPPTESKPLN